MAGTQFPHDCPHCGSRAAGFRVEFVRASLRKGHQYFAMGVCGICDGPLVVRYQQNTGGAMVNLLGHPHQFPSREFSILETWPKGGKDVPEDLPDNVAAFFQQGVSNEKAGNWDAAGAMFRKALDVATKQLDPSLSNKNLFQRIEGLTKAGRLTTDLGTWAHEVRIDGNSSVHDDEPETKDDVEAIHEFCRAVLLYSFTLPALVASRSSAKQNDSASA